MLECAMVCLLASSVGIKTSKNETVRLIFFSEISRFFLFILKSSVFASETWRPSAIPLYCLRILWPFLSKIRGSYRFATFRNGILWGDPLCRGARERFGSKHCKIHDYRFREGNTRSRVFWNGKRESLLSKMPNFYRLQDVSKSRNIVQSGFFSRKP